MGSLSTRLRPTVPSTSRADARMLRLDQTVVMEVRGHHIEPQTKNADCPKNEHRQHKRGNVPAEQVDPQRQGTAVEATKNHISMTDSDDRPGKDSGTCTRKNDHDNVSNNQRSTEDQETCKTETTTVTETVTVNR